MSQAVHIVVNHPEEKPTPPASNPPPQTLSLSVATPSPVLSASPAALSVASNQSSSSATPAAAAGPVPNLSSPLPVLPTGPTSIPAVQPLSSNPYSGPQRHVSFVLLAEFDILKGSQLRYQYPRPTKIKENVLAESMLPEGAHLRESDWTISFLSNHMMQSADIELQKSFVKLREKHEKDPANANVKWERPENYIEEIELQDAPHDPATSSKPPHGQGYLCMLNLVRTKMDKSVKRGAIVKALAICTRHRFYNIFKPLLMIALDQYFESNNPCDQQQILVNLYHTINNMPLHQMPTPSPLLARLSRAIRLRSSTNPSASDYFSTSVKWASLPTPGTGSSAVVPASTPSPSTQAAVLPMRIPISMEYDEVLEGSVMTLVNRFQANIMTIYTALLAEKRILFVGYQQPASICCECVLSACLLIAPPITGVIHRAFPYANLVNLDFLQVPGYIAGVTNPIFEQRTNWYDLLCNISNGEVTLSPAYAEEIAASNASSAPFTPASSNAASNASNIALTHGDNSSRLASLDSAFFSELLHGVSLKHPEEWFRCMFRDATTHFLHLVNDTEQFLFDDHSLTQLVRWYYLSANQYRIKQFLKSKQHASWVSLQKSFISGFDSALGEMDPIIRHHVRTLQLLSGGNTSTSANATNIMQMKSAQRTTVSEFLVVFNDFHTYVRSREEILEFLAMLPESQGGLLPVALGLLHKHPKVRAATVELMQRIDGQLEGNKCVSSLNYFLLMTFYRHMKAAGKQLQEYNSSDEENDDPNLLLSPSSVGHTPFKTQPLQVVSPPLDPSSSPKAEPTPPAEIDDQPKLLPLAFPEEDANSTSAASVAVAAVPLTSPSLRSVDSTTDGDSTVFSENRIRAPTFHQDSPSPAPPAAMISPLASPYEEMRVETVSMEEILQAESPRK